MEGSRNKEEAGREASCIIADSRAARGYAEAQKLQNQELKLGIAVFAEVVGGCERMVRGG